MGYSNFVGIRQVSKPLGKDQQGLEIALKRPSILKLSKDSRNGSWIDKGKIPYLDS